MLSKSYRGFVAAARISAATASLPVASVNASFATAASKTATFSVRRNGSVFAGIQRPNPAMAKLSSFGGSSSSSYSLTAATEDVQRLGYKTRMTQFLAPSTSAFSLIANDSRFAGKRWRSSVAALASDSDLELENDLVYLTLDLPSSDEKCRFTLN